MTKVRWSYAKARDCAKRIVDARIERARKLCKGAGLDPTLLGIHPNNAMCSLRAGRPWKGIDYHKVRRCLWIMRHAYDANRILDRYCRKRDKEDRFWISRDRD